MSPKQTTALRLDSDLLDAMRRLKETDGIPVTTQLEMAAREWLKKRGIVVKKKTARQRGSSRKRA